LSHATSLYQAAPSCSLDLGRVSGQYGVGHAGSERHMRTRMARPGFQNRPQVWL
jgi:hypothetical protein